MASSTSQINATNTLENLPVSDAIAPYNLADYGIENMDIKTASGLTLSDTQRLLTGSVLDLFAGRPSVKLLSLWTDNATFENPITTVEGRNRYSAHWYGLAAAFSEIERLSHQVTSTGNPITMDLKTRYVFKSIGNEETIQSVAKIYTEGNRITRVEDRWNGQLPEGVFKSAMRNLYSAIDPAVVNVSESEEEEAASKKA